MNNNQYKYAVFYNKFPFDEKEITQKVFDEDFVLLMSLDGRNLEDVFQKMQGEVWSPNGEARSIIQEFGLNHTSMMVGDIIWNIDTDRFYQISDFGFTKLNLEFNRKHVEFENYP